MTVQVRDTEIYLEKIKHAFYGDGDFAVYPIEDCKVIEWRTVNDDPLFREIQFAAYLVVNTRVIKEPWREPLVRLNNIYVCRLDELDTRRELRRVYPTQNYIGGEIFIKGIKDSIKITRESFDTNSEKYRVLWATLVAELNPYFREAARKYELRNEATHFFVNEQINLPDVIKKSLEEVMSIWSTNTPKEVSEKFALIEQSPSVLKDRPGLDEELQQQLGIDLQIHESIDTETNEHIVYYMRPTAGITEPEIATLIPNIALGHTSDFQIRINPNFFAPKSVEINNLGQVTILTKHGRQDDPSFETDLSAENKVVYINFFNASIRTYQVSVFEVEAMLKAAAASTESKEEFLQEALGRLRKEHARKQKHAVDLVNSFLAYGR